MSTITFDDIQNQISEIFEKAEDELLTKEERENLEKDLETLANLEAQKIDSVAYFIQKTLAEVEFHKEQSRIEAQKAKTLQNRADFLKALYKGNLIRNNITKVKGDRFTMSLRKSKVVELSIPPEYLPEEYQKKTITIEPKKKELKEAIEKNGEVIKGVDIKENLSLQIR